MIKLKASKSSLQSAVISGVGCFFSIGKALKEGFLPLLHLHLSFESLAVSGERDLSSPGWPGAGSVLFFSDQPPLFSGGPEVQPGVSSCSRKPIPDRFHRKLPAPVSLRVRPVENRRQSKVGDESCGARGGLPRGASSEPGGVGDGAQTPAKVDENGRSPVVGGCGGARGTQTTKDGNPGDETGWRHSGGRHKTKPTLDAPRQTRRT